MFSEYTSFAKMYIVLIYFNLYLRLTAKCFLIRMSQEGFKLPIL